LYDDNVKVYEEGGITEIEYVFDKGTIFDIFCRMFTCCTLIEVLLEILLDNSNVYPIAPKLAGQDKVAFDVKLSIFKLDGASAYANGIDVKLFTIVPVVLNR
jgi:hypothetical protein